MKQQTLAMAAADQGFEQYCKPRRRGEFLATMERMISWAQLCAVVEPYIRSAAWATADRIGADAADSFHQALVEHPDEFQRILRL